jgi:hypothetical protein
VKWYLLTQKKSAKRRYAAHPINDLPTYGEFHHLYKDLRKHQAKFFEYMRMRKETFDYIVPIQEKNTCTWYNCHAQPISHEERLMVIIR